MSDTYDIAAARALCETAAHHNQPWTLEQYKRFALLAITDWPAALDALEVASKREDFLIASIQNNLGQIERLKQELEECEQAKQGFSRVSQERGRVVELEAALKRIRHELIIPAAEYVPAIPACVEIIDAALERKAGGKPTMEPQGENEC